MTQQSKKQIPNGREPLLDYPWSNEISRLLIAYRNKPAHYHAFLFDLIMSLAYVDSTAGLEKSIEFCKNAPDPYNAHIGFINLCGNCHANNYWQYQKAAKPQSGVIGKLSSEIILKFIECLYSHFSKVEVLGGTGLADAKLEHIDGTIILAEVKSAPLITFPLLLDVHVGTFDNHKKANLSNSQVQSFNTALLVFENIIPLGKVQTALWPFKPAVDFLIDKQNESVIEQLVTTWQTVKTVYETKDKTNPHYYLTNACGQPPSIAKTECFWPAKEVISDGKTTVGMDRTDDIKKGLYQTLKIGTQYFNELVKTAIISNLPAIRHKADYVEPIVPILWGHENNLELIDGKQAITRQNLRYVVDYIITLEAPLLRGSENV